MEHWVERHWREHLETRWGTGWELWRNIGLGGTRESTG